MVEVFKTNVQTQEDAQMLLDRIKQLFENYECNFDLEDCDHILRVETKDNHINAESFIRLFGIHGYVAELLDDF